MTSQVQLSICIPTLNRARFIGETLDSIKAQLRDNVEVVIVDGGSTDDTAEIVAGYVERFPHIRYVRSPKGTTVPSNQGFDRDCNLAVELARGTYCWLMTDDDLLVDVAIAEVLSRINAGHDLIFACARVCSVDFAQTLVPSLPSVPQDQQYDRMEWNSFVAEMGRRLTFLGAVIIRRALWQARERERFFGTGFVHVGVILSAPMDSVVVLARPLVVVRYGNALWRSRAFDIWFDHWPQLIWSFDGLPDFAKAAITPRYPYKSLRKLLWWRALGAYSIDKYRQHLASEPRTAFRIAAWAISRMPIRITNALSSLYLAMRPPSAMSMYDLLHCGYAGLLTRRMAQLRGIR
jgi:abequosyltransferase